jgi:lycopene beta-cyclase
VRSKLRPEQYRIRCGVEQVAATHVLLSDGERIEAEVVLDARGPVEMPGVQLGWQKFVGRTYRFEQPHGIARPMIMDARVPQHDGYRFVYLLPFGPGELMIEDTYYSESSDLSVDRLSEGLDRIAARHGSVISMDQETGVLPVLIEGKAESLWEGGKVPLLGIRGGFFHPTTGYSLGDSAANALFLCEQRSFAAPDIYAAFRARAERLWRERHFFQLLNRMLFRAARPDQRYRVLEHFYRLPDAVIARFYAGELTPLDKVRILSGRPPVPIGRALRATQRQAV